MKIVVKKDMTFNGTRYRAGTILDIPPNQYDMATMFNNGTVGVFIAVHAYKELEDYLDEKGVEYTIVADLDTPCSLLISNVYPKFFHEVVVPGIIEICKRKSITIKARNYEKVEGTRALELQLRWRTEEVRENVGMPPRTA